MLTFLLALRPQSPAGILHKGLLLARRHSWQVFLISPPHTHFGVGFPCVLMLKDCASSWFSQLRGCQHSRCLRPARYRARGNSFSKKPRAQCRGGKPRFRSREGGKKPAEQQVPPSTPCNASSQSSPMAPAPPSAPVKYCSAKGSWTSVPS